MKGRKAGVVLAAIMLICVMFAGSVFAADAAAGRLQAASDAGKSAAAVNLQAAEDTDGSAASVSLQATNNSYWKMVNGKWKYYSNMMGGYVKNQALIINNKAYLFDDDGYWVSKKGWFRVQNYRGFQWYYVLSNGTVARGWKKIGGSWYCFFGPSSYPIILMGHANGIHSEQQGVMFSGGMEVLYEGETSSKKMKSAIYCFKKGGQMVTGWYKDDKKQWYYFDKSSGKAVSGWQKIKGKWYYFSPFKQKLVTNSPFGYYETTGCVMQTGWQKISGKWYYFNSSGVWTK